MGAAPSPRAIAQAAAAAELQHWRLRTLLVLLRAAVAREGALEPLLGRHAALRDTLDAAADAGLADLTLDDAIERLDRRAQGAPTGPLSRLRDALGLGADGLGCFVAAALAADDPRLAAFVDELHGRAGRPTRATLALAFGAVAGSAALQRLRGAGALLEGEQDPGLAVPAALWELACGLPPDAGRWQHWPREALMPLPALILPAALRARLEAPPAPATWLLRGSPGSGRRTLAGALARAAGRGLVAAVDAPALASLGAAAALLDAAPLLSFEPAPARRSPGRRRPDCPRPVSCACRATAASRSTARRRAASTSSRPTPTSGAGTGPSPGPAARSMRRWSAGGCRAGGCIAPRRPCRPTRPMHWRRWPRRSARSAGMRWTASRAA
ncbi:MAG: hypothetical protein KIT35_18415 [Piscinibacter sp.]|uniref:hypothetical protein n=1 Tax=Piscinibacter sp. TaxID=1903157 RepID=UPI00258D9B02|nr:hypothetical protein [Piscinibacter sp.]MCW5665808.1 hypothetical protein [Piscinibacter sp.]